MTRGGGQWLAWAGMGVLWGEMFLEKNQHVYGLGVLGEQRGLSSLLQFWPRSTFSKPQSPEAHPLGWWQRHPRPPIQLPPPLTRLLTRLKREMTVSLFPL